MAKKDNIQTNEPSPDQMTQEEYVAFRNAQSGQSAEVDNPAQSDESLKPSDPSLDTSADLDGEDENDVAKFSKRFERLTRRAEKQRAIAEKERKERERLEARIAELEKQGAENPKPKKAEEEKPPIPTEYPNPDDYEDPIEYINALEAYSDAQERAGGGDDTSSDNLNEVAASQSEPEIKPSSAPKEKTTWDDLVEIIDDSEEAPDDMISNLADLMRKGEIVLNEEMADWLVVNEDRAIDVLNKFLEKNRLSRRVSRMPVNQMKKKLAEIADTDMNDLVTYRPSTSISDVRATGGSNPNEIDISQMSQEEYKRMRMQQDAGFGI